MIQQSLEMLMKYQAQDCRSPSVTLQPVTNHFAFPFHVQAASLEFLRNIPTLCQSLVEQTQELVAHSKDTHWVDLHCSTLEQSEWCDLEKLAHWICISHLQSSPPEIQQSMAGAEWWVQIKRQNEQGDQGIELHYDKDETLAELWDLGSFPTLSTVTYLTANPALPTLIYPHSYHDDETREIPSCIVSYPSFLGKHLAFDGRLLHGAPYHEALLQQQQSQQQTFRVTFLVNLWTRPPLGITSLSSEIRSSIRLRSTVPFNIPPPDQSSIIKLSIPSIAVPPSTESIELPFVSPNEDAMEDEIDCLVLKMVQPGSNFIQTMDTALLVFAPGNEAHLQRLE